MKSRLFLMGRALSLGGPLPASAEILDAIPSGFVGDGAGRFFVTWPTEPGYAYKVARSIDLTNLDGAASIPGQAPPAPDPSRHIYLPDLFHGFGQPLAYEVTLPDVPATPPAVDGSVLPSHVFFLTGFPDGSALASWPASTQGGSSESSTQQAFLPAFDLTDGAGGLFSGFVYVTALDAATSAPLYELILLVSGGPPNPSYASLAPDPAEIPVLQLLSSRNTEVRAAFLNPPNASPAPAASSLFDDQGHPLRQFYSVFRFRHDSDLDGQWNHDELAAGIDLSPYTPDAIPQVWRQVDTDGDGVPNAFETDALGNPAPHPLVSEIMVINDDSLVDGYGRKGSDWLEIHNPSPTVAMNLSDWLLTDDFDTVNGMPAPDWKYTFPAGVTLPPGGFLLVIARAPVPAPAVETAGFLYVSEFGLGTGDCVAIGKPDGTCVDHHDIGPTHSADVSFGYGADPEAAALVKGRYFFPSTPGTLNQGPGYLGICGVPSFSPQGGFFGPGASVAVTLSSVSPDDTVFYTKNCAAPTTRSEMFEGAPLALSSSTVVRAFASRNGYLPSRSVTQSFLFSDSVLGTAPQDHQIRPPGYPFATLDQFPAVNPTVTITPPVDYAMDPAVIAEEKNALAAAMDDAPVVSIVLPVLDLFGLQSAGIYANSRKTLGPADPANGGVADPLGLDWERVGAFEYFAPATGTRVSDNAVVTMNGASARMKTKTDKNSLRVKFTRDVSAEGKGKLDFEGFKPLLNSNLDEFDTLILRQTTHDSWTQKEAEFIRVHACFIRETFARELHRRMGITAGNPNGYLAAHSRWVHLYLNGLYWGVYLLSERVDEDFAKSYVFEESDYDVIADGVATSGDTQAWNSLATLCATVRDASTSAVAEAAYAQVLALLDMDNYIDYMIVNTFLRNIDWAGHNYRAVRERPSGKFRLLVWDAEWSMAPDTQSQVKIRESQPFPVPYLGGGAALFHHRLIDYAGYRADFRARMALHFGAGGLLGPVNLPANPAGVLWQEVADDLDPLVRAESARWGDSVSNPARRYGNPAAPVQGTWLGNIQYQKNTWLPQRRVHYLQTLYQFSLADPASHSDVPPFP